MHRKERLKMKIHKSFPFPDDYYVLFQLKDDDSDDVVGFIEGIPWMFTIEVDENHRRRGFGTALITAFKDHFDNGAERVLIADADESSRQFWTACGFVENENETHTFIYEY